MEERRNARRSGAPSDSSSRTDDGPDATSRLACSVLLWSYSRRLGAVGNARAGNLMRSRVAFLTALLLLVAATLEAHDMFLRPDSFFVRPESRALIRALNG